MPVELHDSSIASWGTASFGQDGPYIFTSVDYCKLLNQDAESADCCVALGISDTGELCHHLSLICESNGRSVENPSIA